MIDALKLILSRSPRAGQHAIQAMQAARINSPTAGTRYLQVLQMALADPDASFTDEEREQLAGAIPDETSTRDYTLRIRLTEPERAELAAAAEAAGKSMSEYARRKLFGPG